jgi:hypothetical protein
MAFVGGRSCREIFDTAMNPLPVRADELLHRCRRCALRHDDFDSAARINAYR